MIDIKDFLKKTAYPNFDENWELSKYTSSKVDEVEGRQIIIHILDIWDEVNENAKPIWIDLVERAGFYPYYIDQVKTEKKLDISMQAKMRMQFFKSDYLPDVYFHEEQKEIEAALTAGKNIAVSAPTSFGKSLLIEEIVARRKFDNILIIQPTLALIDETRKKLKKYTDYYNLVVNTRQKAQEKNIFILTAERVLEYENLPKIDFFVIDEFYKISNRRDDGRIDALNVTLLEIMNNNPQAMFLTPSVDALSLKFREKYKVDFYQTDYALVNTDIQEIRTSSGSVLSGDNKKKRLFKLLSEQSEPSIVYVKSPNEAYKLAKEYLEFLGEQSNVKNPRLDIYEWMDENVSPEWQLKKLLQYGIGAHNGALPRHVVTSEIELFNSGVLNILFATVSLIEGVNTVAKNMIIYSQNKGQKRIDFFDFANIKGRAGRMKQHFTGKVYLFIQEPQIEAFTIDVPAIDQEEVSDEILVNIPNSEVYDWERKEKLNSGLDDELKEIIKDNLLSIRGQKSLYKFIFDNLEDLDFLRWKNIPSYDQLWQTLHLGYKYLKSKNNEKFSQIKAVMALKLVNQTLPVVISEQADYYRKLNEKDPVNKAIDFIFKFQRADANFEIPKLLTVIESLQKHAFKMKGMEGTGDYSMFAALLENEQIDERFQFLIDYGVPSSAIKKISSHVDEKLSGDSLIIEFIKKNTKEIFRSLLPYEKKLLLSAIGS